MVEREWDEKETIRPMNMSAQEQEERRSRRKGGGRGPHRNDRSKKRREHRKKTTEEDQKKISREHWQIGTPIGATRTKNQSAEDLIF